MKTKKRIITILAGIIAIGFVVAAFFVPKSILDKKYNDIQYKVETAPESYYQASNTALAKKASEMLEPYEKINLITGVWDSTCKKASYEDAFLSEANAVTMAKESVDQLHSLGLYPYSLTSNYNNWYSWSTSIYSFSDTTFNTYTGYLWVINFTKFDNSINHTVLMTEDGVILAAIAENANNNMISLLPKVTEDSISQITSNSKVTLQEKEVYAYPNFANTITEIYPDDIITEISEQNSIRASLSFDKEDPTDYLIYQCKTNNEYIYGIIPVEALDKITNSNPQ